MPDHDTETLSLKTCAERLGVHYMTVYRYVRLGMLPASKVGAEWRVDADDLEAFQRSDDRAAGSRDAPWSDRLRSRLMAGDEGGSWKVVEAAMSSGLDPDEIYRDVIGPAMHAIGDGWVHGSTSIADEHRATAIATRLVGRLSARFATRGRPKGRVVIGTPPGEHHALAVSMAADLIRGAGFEVIDLGADLPVESFVEAVVAASPIVAVAISVTGSGALKQAERLIQAVRDATSTPIIVGGVAVTSDEHAHRLGADAYAEDGASAIDYVTGLVNG
ncbi:MAG: cobalamin-dependent protein [Acidimicrobiia bacterium]|nr:cobalamin-dependent protein [Acidimicrobiia bacterium]